MFEPISQILKTSGQQKNSAGLFESARIVFVANKISEDRFEAMTFREGRLFIRAKNAPTAANLRLESGKIINKINRELGKKIVERLIFR